MRLETAIHILAKRYESAKNNPSIYDPLGYALYKTWKDQNRDFHKKQEKNEDRDTRLG